jgi:hypothetical protein
VSRQILGVANRDSDDEVTLVGLLILRLLCEKLALIWAMNNYSEQHDGSSAHD